MFLTLLQSGGAGPGVITGTLSAVESGADTLSAEGIVRIAGELAATETGADTFAATGTAAVSVSERSAGPGPRLAVIWPPIRTG
jgi:hypothetical protein